jgi:hypothetical protein
LVLIPIKRGSRRLKAVIENIAQSDPEAHVRQGARFALEDFELIPDRATSAD